ncbi:MAG: phosphate ABC transporter permease subunit PstC [Bacteroidota bacterium]|nr:phosphate ABC transporter permease subunit PstC [Bacteroidota bacterium]MDP4190337.1 phosphate ABC transporter permease subunit PstC [Bacteroidota bacterium]MDP4193535.1 phosphate ABC transporter permease subunit PstC [Bacteroidota bacterium]
MMRLLKDKIASKVMMLLTAIFVLVAVFIGYGLYMRSRPLLAKRSLWELITSEGWKPFKGEFGFFPFIMGTVWITVLSILIAMPLCLLTSIYLSEYSHKSIRQIARPLIDLLAGIPSVIYGIWGVIIVVPLIEKFIIPYSTEFSTGYNVLAGGIVLAIMIFPLIINIVTDVFNTIPQELRDASLSLGATKWETVKHVILKKALPGIIAATVLAISRAFGETIAVLMVCGNIPETPKSLLSPAYPLPALIANNFGEMLSIPLYDSALLFAALLLFLIIFIFNAVSKLILMNIERKTT